MKERTIKVLGPITVGLLVMTLVMAGVALANGQQCPPSNESGWVKIDSSDLFLYPVDGATAYCFKAGNFITDQIPAGGFGQEGACTEEDIQNCGLSHWAYFVPLDPTPTDVPPTATPTDVPPTATDVPPTPTEVPPTATPDPTPTDVKPTPETTPSDTTPEPTPEDTPTEPPPTETPEPTPTDVPPTQTPPKPPETGGTDGAFLDDPVFVGGLFFIGVLVIAMGVIKLWVRKHVL